MAMVEVIATSSFWIVPVAIAVPMVAPAEGADRVTVKPSSDSAVASPAMSTVIVAPCNWTANQSASLLTSRVPVETLPTCTRP